MISFGPPRLNCRIIIIGFELAKRTCYGIFSTGRGHLEVSVGDADPADRASWALFIVKLEERILLLENEGDSIGTALRQKIPDFKTAAHEQYDAVLRLLDSDF